MIKKIILLLLCFNVLACAPIVKPYRPPVQQGNIITNDMIKQLKPGMSKQQVVDIFGEPVLTDTFDQNTWTYIYTFQASKGPMTTKRVIIRFRNDRVVNYTTDLPVPNLSKNPKVSKNQAKQKN